MLIFQLFIVHLLREVFILYIMADPVSFTASVIGIATLAVQLGDALRKAAEFWEAVQDAPSDIRRLSKQLRLVASVFHTIRLEYETGSIPTNFESMVKDALELAKDDIDQLSELISELSRNLSIANGSLAEYRASLIQVNSRLDVLTTNISSVATTNSTHQIALQASQEMTQSQLFPSGGWRSSAGSVSKSFNQYKTNFLLGTLNIRTISTTHRYNGDDGTDGADNSATNKTFLIEFLMGFTKCRKGFRFMATSNFDRYALDIIRRRPNDSEIFELLDDGNFQAVKVLLGRGEASVHDVDESGNSLLHFASFLSNAQFCTMLIGLGADLYLPNDHAFLPIRVASEPTFSAIVEAGFDLWLLDESHLRHSFINVKNISIWRYIYQHKAAQSIGEYLGFIVLVNIIHSYNTDVVDFLVARVVEEVSTVGTLCSAPPTALRSAFVARLLCAWLDSLHGHWLDFDNELSGSLFEYKLTLFLKELVISDSHNELYPYTISDTYMSGVEEIIIVLGWNIEITNALFRKWTRAFIASGFDVISGTLDGDEETVAQSRLKGHIIRCCRDINFEIVREEFSHLNPMFLCEAGRPRGDETGAGRCLSQVDESFIENGKFCMNVPGQWEEPLSSNSAMELCLKARNGNAPEICYSMHQHPYKDRYDFVTEEDVQRIEDSFQNGTLYGLSEDSPETSGEA
ncbi:hypothetical protein BOTNAR_0034g00390 [Botryotinia narcissicola]|uniref:Uncharacterized protein n=1 Tax=Botryotinia narcissicola TaxID=278944 RepID=A0A4Z1J2F8_9HELO|nr:hypothetical protein BOTNAR_0034g00390 [Botryotinia narcissicola]